MRRGEVYEYTPVISRPGQSRARLIVSSQDVNDAPDARVVLGLHIVDRDPGLLGVRIDDLGWASALTFEVVLRSRLGSLLYTATSDEIEAVNAVLRVAIDL